ncbi:MAG: helix-turn-helix domain-containing protein [Clostridia bacterium]|nr:helix-turn-helix domain-containing protein [Clostridia bacterium]
MQTKIMTEFKYADVAGRSSHFHNSYEVMYVVGGRATITVGANVYKVGPGKLLFFSNLEEHQTDITEAPFCRYFVKLDPAQLNRRLGDIWQLSVFKNRSEGFIHWVDLAEYHKTVTELFRMLGEEYGKDDAYTDEIVVSVIRHLLALCSRVAPERFAFSGSEELQSLAKVQLWIEQHFTEDVKIHEITDKLLLNPAQLSRAFKKATGYTPKQYMMLNRVARAKELLIHTDRSVNDIGTSSGFQDTSNFIRYFKQEEGVTPNEYRRINKL